MKIIKSLEESGSLIKDGKMTKNEANEWMGGFAALWERVDLKLYESTQNNLKARLE